MVFFMDGMLSLHDFCKKLGVSDATGKNWIKLGKIVPQKIDGNIPYFTLNYCDKFINELSNSENNNLKSRRNKSFKTGNSFYNDYIPQNSNNITVAQQLLSYLDDLGFESGEDDIKMILAYCAGVLLKNSGIGNSKEYEYLIEDIAKDCEILKKYPDLKNFKFTYEKEEDILGLLYLSLRNVSSRKSKGAYYTPTNIVRKMVNNTFKDYLSGVVADSCCGSGNFILLLPLKIKPENIYAFDIDDLSIKIARLNFALKYRISDKKFLNEHIKLKNFLTCNDKLQFDYIIGNPPWAYNFNEDEKDFLKNKYKTAQNSNIESYDVICEQALNKLRKNGVLSFVLPEAVLNVKSHKILRQIIAKNCTIKYLEYLGEIFDGVQCPSIIIQMIKTQSKITTKGMMVQTKDKNFIICKSRKINPDCFNFLCDDKEFDFIEQIENIPNKVLLKNHATFALGIVTGDNKKYLSKSKNKHNEIIIKGTDIEKFKIKDAQNYIAFTQNTFQQCAPLSLFRAKEKLLYKFISKKLVFAYDDKKRLTLNSCNILIPEIEGLNVKYILGILNSSVVQFYFEKKFNSLKVLRSHLEQIPIPYVDYSHQKPVIDIVNKILSHKSESKELLMDLNEQCNILYGFDKTIMF